MLTSSTQAVRRAEAEVAGFTSLMITAKDLIRENRAVAQKINLTTGQQQAQRPVQLQQQQKQKNLHSSPMHPGNKMIIQTGSRPSEVIQECQPMKMTSTYS
ncbi:unnamed protein product [Protopolystoma xenopodis]|uniref:Uncharacterized protein n=1 Tax=Protopolystoma xenopodis TaxID=117903 RepID=A0A448X2W6_9PLAT|nr:unnamed protein product [Protopolystoma xenopodis]